MQKSGRLLVGKEALAVASRPGTRWFKTPRECAAALLAAVRKDVMLEWQAQHHEMELSDYEVTYGFVGMPEW
jgi:hypothetical protein